MSLDNTQNYYHLSAEKAPHSDKRGLARIATASNIFKTWEQGDKYLHRVSYGAIDSVDENAHRDGVSDFCISESFLASDVLSLEHWDLSDIRGIRELIDTGFIDQLSDGFFSSAPDCYKALVELAYAESLPELIRLLGFAELNLATLNFSMSHQQLAKILPYLLVSDDEIYSLLKTEYNWEDFTQCEQDSLASAENGISAVFNRTCKLVEAVEKRYFERSITKANELSDLIISILLTCDRPYQSVMEQLTSVSFDSNVCIVMIRMGKADKLNEALLLPKVKISGDPALLLDRCVVYGQSELASLVIRHTPADTLCYHRLSSEAAINVPSSPLEEDTYTRLLEWQRKSAGSDLESAARAGFIQLCEQLLKCEEHELSVLNNAIVAAAEGGYVEVVKLLHHSGAELNAHGNWPIKYANRYDYQQLKTFLLSAGVEDAHFSGGGWIF